ncbi:hypothetical protein [Haloarcula marina]|uniref:hypothetical protein n=1 Tax=Haloarcula marina TaxID=2961574 RepID=UPI0020B7637C|nr:hypothetical protein [Halomicroarcula marina]
MRRRRLLALCGSLLAAPGCMGPANTGDSETTDSVTPVPSPESGTWTKDDERTTTSESSVSVRSAAVQPGVVGPNSPDSIGVFDDAGQYLLLDVGVEGPTPAYEDFVFRFDGSRHPPESIYNGLYREDEWGVQYGDGGGPVVVPLPETGDASDARLSWPGGEWVPSERVRSRLRAPLPPFSVTLDGPETVTADDDPTVRVHVENVGDAPGRFVLALNVSGPRVAYAPVGRIVGDLDPGETATRTFDAKSPYLADPPHEAVYRLDAPGDSQDATVRISPAEDGTETRTEAGTPTDTPVGTAHGTATETR